MRLVDASALAPSAVTVSVAVLVLSVLTASGPRVFHDENHWRALQRAHTPVASVFAVTAFLVVAVARDTLPPQVVALMLATFVIATATLLYSSTVLTGQTARGRRYRQLRADPTLHQALLEERSAARRRQHDEVVEMLESMEDSKAKFRATHGIAAGVDVKDGHAAYGAQQQLHDHLWDAAAAMRRRHEQELERFTDLEP